MNSLTKISSKSLLAWASICFILFFMAWYDTTHAHLATDAINVWVLNTLYIPPLNMEMTSGQEFYRISLDAFTALGEDIILIFVVTVIFIDLIVRREFKALGYCLLASFGILAVTIFCKVEVYSPRPMFPLEFNSFPSGHVARATIWCGIIILLGQLSVFHLSKYWRNVLFIIPVIVAYTRMGLGYHWLSDVIASLVLSLGIFLCVYYLALNKYNHQ